MRRLAVVLLWVPLMLAAPKLSKEDLEKMLQQLSNWGRWGAADQMGALNLITPAKRKQAVALVQEGRPISLAHNAIKEPADDSPPFEHKMIETGSNSNNG